MRAPCASKALGELALPSRASGGPWLALFLLPPSPSPPILLLLLLLHLFLLLRLLLFLAAHCVIKRIAHA